MRKWVMLADGITSASASVVRKTSEQKEGYRNMKKIDSYVCIDLETTGLNPKTDRIIEIGAVRVEKGERTGSFETFINPGRLLSDKVKELTGICDEQLENAPDIAEVLPGLMDFLQDAVLLGHSVLFDYSFIKKAAVNHKMSFERQGIDTLKLARKFLPDLESRSLDFLCRHYQIPHTAHRALADAEATCALYDRLWMDFGEGREPDGLFVPEKLIYQVKRETPITPAQKERLYKLLKKHKLTTEYDLDKLTRNEASRYTDQILAKYGR